jgi:hypothetical protein
VLLFNVLHNLAEQDAQRAVSRAVAALRPGGLVAILEGQHRGGDGNLSFQEAFGELFFLVLSGSRTWAEPILRRWLDDAGADIVKRKRLFTLPGAVLLLARRGRGDEHAPP